MKHEEILFNEPLGLMENYSPNKTNLTELYDELYPLQGAWDDK